MDGKVLDADGGRGKEVVFIKDGSHGSLYATAEGVAVISLFLLVVVVMVTVDKKVEGSAEVLKGKFCLLSLVPPSCVPSNSD